MNIERTVEELDLLNNAVKRFKNAVGVMGTFGADALPEHMACGEANVFAELLEALGMPDEASSLRQCHLDGDEEGDEEMHSDWPEGRRR